jgi:glycosyltransferase involved in cell wall biosynthesis
MIKRSRAESVQVLFLLRSLDYGGAERQVIALAGNLRQKSESVTIATFYPPGPWGKDLKAMGVPLYNLGKRGRWDFFFFLKLIKHVREISPVIVYSHLTTANIFAALLKPMCAPVRVVWGVRSSNMDLERYGWVDRFVYRLECALSRFADLIITNSHAGLHYAIEHGFPEKKLLVIANGIDTDQFCPDPQSRERVRREFGLAGHDILIGLVGRLDPMKDYPTFLKAAALLSEKQEVRFLCVGDGPESYRLWLQRMAKELRVDTRVIWLAAAEDMAALYNGMDVMTSSSSFGEGFSNAIGEAMACGVPCVVTDVGDSKRIIGETGYVVPPRDPTALCFGWMRMLALDAQAKSSLARDARNRIVRYYGTERLVANTWDALKAVP